MPLYPGAPKNQDDELVLLGDDDSMDPEDSEDEIQDMEIPDGYRLQASSRLLSTVPCCREALSLGWARGGLVV